MRLPSLTARRAFWMVLLAGLVMRSGFALATRPWRVVEGTEEVAIARALAERNEFADPYRGPTGPTAHSAPAYPFLLGLVYRAFGGPGGGGELAKEGLAALVSSLQFALLPALAVAAGLPLAAGLLAGLAGALLPLHPYLEVKGEWTAPYAGLVLLLLTLMMIRFWREPDWSLGRAARRGAAFGVGLWFTPVFLPVVIAWLLIELRLFRTPAVREVGRAALVSFAVMAALQLPWTARNAVRLGAPVWSRNSLPLAVQNAYADYARPGFLATLAELERRGTSLEHPNGSVAELARLRALGETAYQAEKRQQAMQWIRSHPGRSLELLGARVVLFWFPLDPGLPRALAHLAISFAAWVGLWLLRGTHRQVFLLVAAIWLTFPAVYYIVASDSRYAYPMFWTKLFAAGFAVSCCWNRLRRHGVGEFSGAPA